MVAGDSVLYIMTPWTGRVQLLGKVTAVQSLA